MAIEIIRDADVSLADLQAIHASGVSVVRSAHVGNLRGYNLAATAAGLPMQLVDHTIVAQRPGEPGDNNYLPGSVVTADAVTPLKLIDPPGGLTIRTRAIDPVSGQTTYLDQLHVASLRRAFPHNREIMTETEYIRAAESISREVAGIALGNMPGLFTRMAEPDGTVRKAPVGSYADLVAHCGVSQLNADPRRGRGVLMPIEVDIVLGFIVEALTKGGNTQYHLSGPDFYHYVKDPAYMQKLNQLYGEVRRRASFGNRLPETLHVRMVNATEARFVSAHGRGAVLHRIFELVEAEVANRSTRSVRIAALRSSGDSPTSADEYIAQAEQERRAIVSHLGRTAIEASELFIGPRDAPYTSQYDILAAGGIDMPPQNTNLTMAQLAIIFKRLQRAREGRQ